MPDEVLYEQSDGVAYITINRPSKANSINSMVAQQLTSAWKEVRDDPSVRVAIVTGRGDKHFCVGVDLQEVAATGQVPSKDSMIGSSVPWSPLVNEVWKPIICVVNGVVAGGGLHLVAEADIVVADPSATFMDTHVSVGMTAAIENIGLLHRLPFGTVMMMTLGGRQFRLSASRAFELGLVDVLAPQGKAMEAAAAVAAQIIPNSPSAVAASKRAIWHAVQLGADDRLKLGWELIQQQWDHPDFTEGPAAFAAKRPPRWSDGEATV